MTCSDQEGEGPVPFGATLFLETLVIFTAALLYSPRKGGRP